MKKEREVTLEPKYLFNFCKRIYFDTKSSVKLGFNRNKWILFQFFRKIYR